MRVYTGCTDVRDDFSALLDGELAADEREALEAHLSDCSECLRALDGLKRVDTVFRRLPPVNAPKGFDAGLREARKPRLFRFEVRRGGAGRMASMMAAAAVLTVVAGIAFVAVRGGSPQATIGPVATEMKPMSAVGETKEEAVANVSADTSAEEDFAASQEAAMASPPSAAAPAEPAPELDGAVTGGRAAAATDAGRDAEPRFEAVFDETAMQETEPEAESAESGSQKATALSDAPGSASAADGDDVPGAEPPLRNAPAEALERMRAVPSPAPAAPAQKAAVSERMPERRGDAWYESGYTDQPITEVARDADAFVKMIEADESLRKYLALRDAVVFRFEDRWYRLKPIE